MATLFHALFYLDALYLSHFELTRLAPRLVPNGSKSYLLIIGTCLLCYAGLLLTDVVPLREL